ncbi:MAG TPA: branched-chain amino acid ABC transporter substrate-binding protein [Symbiobacteriaceae bacterium]|nr:branched-chain amino acid ABC transporter substrate-binding protein [Symbiobacteriaceae bacterium]
MKRFAALVLAGALFVTGCGGAAKTDGGAAKGPITVTIATMSPLSGGSADLGESIKFATDLAIRDRAAELEKAGIKVNFLAMDDQGKPEQGTQLAEQLITKKEVIGLVGTLNSGVAIPVSQKLSGEGLVMISPANTATQVTDRKLPNMNRVVARDDMQGPAAIKFIKGTLGAKSIFIIHDKTPYGQGLAEEVKKSAGTDGLKVEAFEGVNVGDKDFSAVLTKVKSANPDAIFFGGMYSEAAQILKQMKEKSIAAKFVGADGLDSGDLVKLAGEAANGVYYTSVAADVSKSPFAPKYQEFAKKPADGFAAFSYDATNVLLNALVSYAKANPGKTPSRKEFAELVRKTSGFKGVAAQITFDEKGDNKESKVYIYQIQNAKYPGVQVQ